MRKQAVATVDIEALVQEIGELSRHENELRNELHRIAQEEPELKRRIKEATRAKKRADEASVFGLREVPEEFAANLEAAERAVNDFEARRAQAQDELETTKAKRIELISQALRPAWRERVEAIEARYEAGQELADRVEPLVKPFIAAYEREQKADALFNRVIGSLGGGGLRLRDDLKRDIPEPRVPDEPLTRQGARRSIRLLKLYSQDLTHRW